MNEQYSTDWWLWQMYRQVANFINDPSEENDRALKSLSSAYKQFAQDQVTEGKRESAA